MRTAERRKRADRHRPHGDDHERKRRVRHDESSRPGAPPGYREVREHEPREADDSERHADCRSAREGRPVLQREHEQDRPRDDRQPTDTRTRHATGGAAEDDGRIGERQPFPRDEPEHLAVAIASKRCISSRLCRGPAVRYRRSRSRGGPRRFAFAQPPDVP